MSKEGSDHAQHEPEDTPIPVSASTTSLGATVIHDVHDQIQEVDIEHMPVEDDPRNWSNFRKNVILGLIASGSTIAGFGANIQNPAIPEMEVALSASASQVSLSISLFIAIQGIAPLIWGAVSEIKGRKTVYLISLVIFVVASIIVALSKTIQLVIGFRCLQAAGSSSVMTLGAASLADIFDPHERGTKMGIYYIAPLLGTSIGPIFGGALTKGFTWRGPFWFLAISAGGSLLLFVCFFKDTFRKERSALYQSALKRQLKEAAIRAQKAQNKKTSVSIRSEKMAQTPVADPEKQEPLPVKPKEELPDVKISLLDIIPLKPMRIVLGRPNNITILLASGFLFAFNFVIGFTTSRTLGGPGYNYGPLQIGLVLIAFGFGSMAGSVLGGRWSDRVLARLTAQNGGVREAEMRLHSMSHALWLFPACVVAIGWLFEKQVHIAGIVVMLFVCGFWTSWMYSPTLAYIVDANVGRSSTIISMNSAIRGIEGCVQTIISVPLQDHLGNGWMYTLFGSFIAMASILIVITRVKGRDWRVASEQYEKEKEKKKIQTSMSTGASTPSA